MKKRLYSLQLLVLLKKAADLSAALVGKGGGVQSFRTLLSCLYSVPTTHTIILPLLQVRSTYRKRGWAFTDPQGIEQCAKEGYVQKLQEQQGEGCHLWGFLEVNKVIAIQYTPF